MFAKISADANNSSARLAGIGLMLFGVWLFSFGDALGKHLVATYAVGQLLLLRSIASRMGCSMNRQPYTSRPLMITRGTPIPMMTFAIPIPR